MLIKMNYHQYLENYTLKKIEDIDCQKTIKDINFTDLKNLFFRTRTKKYDYFVIMHSSLKNRAGVLSLMHWNKRSSVNVLFNIVQMFVNHFFVENIDN